MVNNFQNESKNLRRNGEPDFSLAVTSDPKRKLLRYGHLEVFWLLHHTDAVNRLWTRMHLDLELHSKKIQFSLKPIKATNLHTEYVCMRTL